MATIGTINDEGACVDLYIPRKCHATNSLITSFDHSAVQISIANVNAKGMIDGTTTTFCIAGYLRAQGESDHAINHLAISKGIVRIKTGKKPRAKASKGGRGAHLTLSRKGFAQRGAAQQQQQQQRGPAARRGAAQQQQRGPAARRGAAQQQQRGPAARRGAAGSAQQQQQRGPAARRGAAGSAQQQQKQQRGGRPPRDEEGDRRQQQRGTQRGNQGGKPFNSRSQQGDGGHAHRHHNRA